MLSLSRCKSDYISLVKNLTKIYLSSSGNCVLDSAARSLVSLCDGNHARVAKSRAQLYKVAIELYDCVVKLISSDDSTIAT